MQKKSKHFKRHGLNNAFLNFYS